MADTLLDEDRTTAPAGNAPGPSRRVDAPATVLLADPSRFTAPYDAGLAEGLLANGAKVVFAVRPLRKGEAEELPPGTASPMFYRRFDQPGRLPGKLQKIAKALSHVAGLARLMATARRLDADVVHFQWAVIPIFDVVAMWLLKRSRPVVMTVHDTVPFNGEKISLFQNLGFDMPIRLADKVIVHTAQAKQALLDRGLPGGKITIIPHGPLAMKAEVATPRVRKDTDPVVLTLFGQLKPYKGVDLLVEAVAKVADRLRGRAKIVVAGAAHMDLGPIEEAIAAKGLGDIIDLRIGRLSDEAMADLFDETDGFLFPYRQIDASGVFFLTMPLGKWMIASRLGVFGEHITPGETGTLLPPGNVDALAEALVEMTDKRLAPTGRGAFSTWAEIGAMTLRLYDEAKAERRR
ncbi:Glycosyltransferase KanE [Hartmannibacter diazotrophicus]|uniref:Glycosyltransferase KanE n=1 Tax=Hartmannibacter diazotrophicus TaxID=1482074 RepID=A0A2C9DCP3_9HYPH|nr:glycosyltransferase [Hartmannibacter diazotrophicus]SON58003.1 Glycosyltransferase KanE [Hartmannibacter diazotrophicus]